MEEKEISYFGHREIPTLISVENNAKLNIYLEKVIDWASKDINPETVGAVTELINSLKLN